MNIARRPLPLWAFIAAFAVVFLCAFAEFEMAKGDNAGVPLN